MPEIGLDGASVVAVVGELEPAGVPQHVGMNEKGEFRTEGHSRAAGIENGRRPDRGELSSWSTAGVQGLEILACFTRNAKGREPLGCGRNR